MQHLFSLGLHRLQGRWLTLLCLLLWRTAAVAQTATIGSTAVPVVAPATSSYFFGPLYRSAAGSTFDYSRYAHLYTPAELGVPTGAVITQLAWLKADAGTLTGNNVFNVLLANSALTTLGTAQTWGTLTVGTTAGYASTTQQVTGVAGDYFSVTLSQPFVYTGGNLLLLTDHQKLGTATGVIDFVTNPATGRALGFASGTAPAATTNLTAVSYGDRRPTLRVTYTPGGPCTAPPTAGTTLASAATACAGSSVSFSLQGTTFGSGQTYQWQVSTGGSAFANIANATSTSYTTGPLAATATYRAVVTCGGQSANSAPATVAVNPVTYASLPVTESFENPWVDACDTRDVPTNNWRNTPVTGNNSWRRDDDGAAAAWANPTFGAYTPTGSQGTRSARFHSYNAPNGAVGTLDLFVNLSAAGAKRLGFNFINTTGDDSLIVQLSADGGATFARLAGYNLSGTVAAGFSSQVLPIVSTSATAVLRFRGRSDDGLTDIGLDNIVLESATGCLTPAILTVTTTTATTAAVSWLPGGAGTYTVFHGPTGFNPALPASATNVYTAVTGLAGPPYTITGLAASTAYQFYVQQNCGAGTNSALAGPVGFATACITPLYAALPVTESFENAWLSRCGTREVPTNNWRNTPVTGNNSWRRDDDGAVAAWTSPAFGQYTPTSSQGARSARFHSSYAPNGAMGTFDLFVNLSAAGAKRLSFDFVNTSGADSLVVQLSTDGGATFARLAGYNLSGTVAAGFSNRVLPLTATSATAVIRFRGRADFGSTDIGLDNIVLESATGCLTPATLAVTATTTTSATVTWLTGGAGTYTVLHGPTGFNPALPASATNVYTTVAGLAGPPYTITGLTASTAYQFYVQQNCGAGTNSALAGPVGFASACIAPPYAALPVTQSFENAWLSRCDTREVPTNNWRNTPATGNNSWRRDDDGAAAAWSNTFGAYTPAASQGVRSARFHSYNAPNPFVGSLDLFVDLSAAGAKRMSFDFVNTTGTDSLIVQLSTDGGATFARLAGYGLSGTAAAGFSTQVLNVNATSATAVLRFRGQGGTGFTDIGLDNIVLESATGCLTPANLTATTTTTTTATVSWLTGGTGTYSVTYGPTGFTPGGTGSTTVPGLTAAPYTITGLTPGTTYQFYVTLNCAGGTNSGAAGPQSFTTQIVNDEPCTATVLSVNAACTPLSTTTVNATTTPISVYGTGGQGTGCGFNTTPRDVWFRFTTAATGPTSTQVRISVTGGPASVVRAYSGAACGGPLTFISCAGTASNIAAPNLNLLGLLPNTTYYVRVSDYSNFNNIPGNFTICASPVPNCTTPAGLTAGPLTSTTATVSWAAPVVSGSTFTLYYGLTGFTPGGAGSTSITGLTSQSRVLTGLAPNTGYCFSVQQVCGGFNGNSTIPTPVCFTTPFTAPSSDEPCGAAPLSSTPLGGSNVGATTSGQNGINTPACSPAPLPKDVWFLLTPAGSSTTLTVTGTAAGMVRVFTSPDCAAGPFTQVFCQGSGQNNTNVGPITLTGLTPGARYYVAVSGYGSSDATGAFTISATNVLAAKAQANTSALVVYPNPSGTGQLTLRLSGAAGPGRATLLNALGQAMRTAALAGAPELQLSTRGLAPGVYTLRVAVDGQILTRKVVLE